MVFSLSQKGSGKKIGVTESSVDTALCDTIFRFLGYLKKVLEPKKIGITESSVDTALCDNFFLVPEPF